MRQLPRCQFTGSFGAGAHRPWLRPLASQCSAVAWHHDATNATHGTGLTAGRRLCGGDGLHAELRLRAAVRPFTAVSNYRNPGAATCHPGRNHVPAQDLSAEYPLRSDWVHTVVSEGSLDGAVVHLRRSMPSASDGLSLSAVARGAT